MDKEKLKKVKRELDKILNEEGIEELRAINKALSRVIVELENNRPIDIKKELNEIKKAVEEKEVYPQENIIAIVGAVERLIEKPEKDYDKNFRDLVLAVKSIKTYDQIENTERVIKTIKEELVKVKPKDYETVFKQILIHLKSIEASGKEVKGFKILNPQKENPLILKTFQGILKKVSEVIKAFVTNEKPDQAIAVRLVDATGNHFYNAAFSAGSVSIDTSTIEDNTEPSETPTIYNVAMAVANTEVSQLLPANTRKVDIKLRATNAMLKIAFVATESGTNYITIPYGSSLHLENVKLGAVTVYAQSPTGGQTLEILAWT